MTTPSDMPQLRAAVLAAVVLFAGGCFLLWAADEPTDVAAVAGGSGVVLAGALLGLTTLVGWWRRDPSYVESIAAVLEDERSDHADASDRTDAAAV